MSIPQLVRISIRLRTRRLLTSDIGLQTTCVADLYTLSFTGGHVSTVFKHTARHQNMPSHYQSRPRYTWLYRANSPGAVSMDKTQRPDAHTSQVAYLDIRTLWGYFQCWQIEQNYVAMGKELTHASTYSQILTAFIGPPCQHIEISEEMPPICRHSYNVSTMRGRLRDMEKYSQKDPNMRFIYGVKRSTTI